MGRSSSGSVSEYLTNSRQLPSPNVVLASPKQCQVVQLFNCIYIDKVSIRDNVGDEKGVKSMLLNFV